MYLVKSLPLSVINFFSFSCSCCLYVAEFEESFSLSVRVIPTSDSGKRKSLTHVVLHSVLDRVLAASPVHVAVPVALVFLGPLDIIPLKNSQSWTD
uniref:Secreted protein n=1 Tax=Heterorhabditis bacteriophora TaxID=37862 RepID=A0A1I7XD42_HETBA